MIISALNNAISECASTSYANFSPMTDLSIFLIENEQNWNKLKEALQERSIMSLQETGSIQPLNEEEQESFFAKIGAALKKFWNWICEKWDKFIGWIKSLFTRADSSTEAAKTEETIKVGAEAHTKAKKEGKTSITISTTNNTNEENTDEEDNSGDPEEETTKEDKAELRRKAKEERIKKDQEENKDFYNKKLEKHKQKELDKVNRKKPKPQEVAKSDTTINLVVKTGYLYNGALSGKPAFNQAQEFLNYLSNDYRNSTSEMENKKLLNGRLLSIANEFTMENLHTKFSKNSWNMTDLKEAFINDCKGKNSTDIYSDIAEGLKNGFDKYIQANLDAIKEFKNNIQKYMEDAQNLIKIQAKRRNKNIAVCQDINYSIGKINEIFSTAYSVQLSSKVIYFKYIKDAKNYFTSIGKKFEIANESYYDEDSNYIQEQEDDINDPTIYSNNYLSSIAII